MRDHLLDVVMDVIEEMTEEYEPKDLQQGMAVALERAGVRSSDIRRIIEWVQGFGSSCTQKNLLKEPMQGQYFRVFSVEEVQHMTVEAQSFLLNLLRNQVIHLDLFERILNQILMLKGRQVDLHHVQWISFMVVMNQSKDPSRIALFEQWVMNMDEHFGMVVH